MNAFGNYDYGSTTEERNESVSRKVMLCRVVGVIIAVVEIETFFVKLISNSRKEEDKEKVGDPPYFTHKGVVVVLIDSLLRSYNETEITHEQ